MKSYLDIDEWKIEESGFHPKFQRVSESIFSIGNGNFGQRGNFEEVYSGDSLQGNYVGGIYYPDKTRVGWWKNGYPEYFAKVLNSCDWLDLQIQIGDIELDLAHADVTEFKRTLNMQQGILGRSFRATLSNGAKVHIQAERFCLMSDNELAALQYSCKIENFSGVVKIKSGLNNNVHNEDANYDEQFWLASRIHSDNNQLFVQARTKKTNFHVGTWTKQWLTSNDERIEWRPSNDLLSVSHSAELDCAQELQFELIKIVRIVSDLNLSAEKQLEYCLAEGKTFKPSTFVELKSEQIDYWSEKWEEMDIQIHGDPKAQQGIRFNIFQLYQTYTGHDHRLNIGPKGFTGEKYGGSTYWDTEAYCIPFYLGTSDQSIARNLLKYRYYQLAKAIENAENLGFTNGAALYPMVTMNGEECHNEWEITFEEIHRNGAMIYAIYDYIRYCGDKEYLLEHGLELMIGVCRFWAQRVNLSKEKNAYVILGVTGPNEYENNVNNNWYTNYIAKWCLQYTIESIHWAKAKNESRIAQIFSKTHFEESVEIANWSDIIERMYLPQNEELGIFVQQDGFFDKEIMPSENLKEADRPINQNWSWDRILRSCFIKQADVLQGIYFFEDQFSGEEIKRNFEFYEPLTVHESSLSPCVHSILASKLNQKEKAYEMYLRTSRLDLDDYNNDTEDGCHITSMAGTWMSVIKGFAGQRVKNDRLCLNPALPQQWNALSFHLNFRGNKLRISISKDDIRICLLSSGQLDCYIYDNLISLTGNVEERISLNRHTANLNS